ncbi:MAG: carbamoyl phosphate synthase small subunit, partial [Spirochaetaceae bacterium]|nr:carbamoyl phosphate synthase small subunit [Spirochaetaceae bacterium]
MDRCALVLDDGSWYEGYSFGSAAATVDEIAADGAAPKGIGEVVFNTSMTGYHEVVTDPSYTGQIVAMTYPHIGNYGCDAVWNESRSESGAPGNKGGTSGMVVRELFAGRVPVNRHTLDSFLGARGTPGITGIDTRRLTLSLRDHGSRNGAIVRPGGTGASRLSSVELSRVAEILSVFPSMTGRNLVAEAGQTSATVANPSGQPHIALLDCGVKANIVRELVRRKCRVTVIPSNVAASEIRAVGADALLVSNGPGDPSVLLHQVELVKGVIGTMPVFGICLGHQ